jgi:oxygen-dependent protoporphyrinogen oxidase
VSGLTAALAVVRALPAARVTVLEAGDRPGGKLRREHVAGHLVDVGAEAMLALRPEAVDLLESIGAGDEIVAPDTASASVWSRGTLHPLPRATLMGIPADPEATRGLLTDAELERLRAEQAWPGGPLTEDVAVGEYVSARLGQAVVDRLVEPLLGGVYAGHASRLSLRAALPQAWPTASAGGSLVALAARAFGPRGAGVVATPGAPPPGGSGGRTPRRAPFAGIRGGVGRFPDLLIAAMEPYDVVIRLHTPATALERTPDGWAVLAGTTTSPERIEADAVVLTVSPAPTARLLAPFAPGASAILAAMETASTAVITLAVGTAGLGDLPGSGFLVPPVEGLTIKAGTFSGVKWGWTGALSRDTAYLRASIGRAGEEAALQREDTELVELAAREVGQVIGRPLPPLVDSHVQRWEAGLPQYTVGHLDRVAAIRAEVAGLPGIEVAGSAYDGVGIPAVISSATTAAAAVVHGLAAEPAGRGRMGA